MNAIDIAHKIRKLREKKDYSQTFMADKLGISQNAYSKIEIGLTKISLDRFFEIAKVLNVTPFELLKESEQSNNTF